MEDPVLHVLVIGFHHKKGCQYPCEEPTASQGTAEQITGTSVLGGTVSHFAVVEFSYPPLIEGNSFESHEIPEEWKHIPSLALPDGAHNFVKDTVYFVLPGRNDNPHTVYGVSCYRQMDASNLINKTADVTRSTVQKSVCVLSRLPLFGLIKAKLELITHAYFDERDFSQVSLLEETYKNLNSSLTESLLEGTQVFLGLSARDLVIFYKHKVIVLFKLLMLERRVLFFGSPVESLCQTLLGFLSLFPGMLESGLSQSCNQWGVKKLSPNLAVADFNSDLDENEQFLEVCYHTSTPETPLTELLGHMNNSGLNLVSSGDIEVSSSNISDEPESTLGNSEAPESPSIPRDPLNSVDNSSHKVQFPNGGHITRKEPQLSQGSRSRSASSTDSERLTVHGFSRAKRQFSVEDSKMYSSGDIGKNHLIDSPLANLDTITHIENVQREVAADALVEFSKKLTEFDNNSNDKLTKSRNNSLTLNSTTSRQETDELIEDLDSPESISKIDKEDCFSWEQDRLLLTIDHELTSNNNKAGSSTPSSSISESRESIVASESGKESVSDDTASSLNKVKKSKLGFGRKESEHESPTSKQKKPIAIKSKLSAAFVKRGKKKEKSNKADDPLTNHEGDVVLHQDQFGYPLAIFTKGAVCYPYLSLQYHDILTDVNYRSFVLGATNVLFKQRRQLIDVFIEIQDGKLDIRDKELQKQLNLTTADLRFADYLVKTVTDDRPGLFLDGTEWEGSDEWVRAQFKHYLNSLLSTVVADDPKLVEDFGTSFLTAWKTTHNFRFWVETDHIAIKEFPPGHPFQGNLSMADVRVRFNHTLQSTERGRKINAAVVSTGKYVVQTGKAVGGAFTSAKSAVSGWFSSWRNNDKVVEGQEKQVSSEDIKRLESHGDNISKISSEIDEVHDFVKTE